MDRHGHFEICEGRTLLVVDDDGQNRAHVVALLLREVPTMRVLAAADGLQALDIMAKRAVDLMLLDWEMPRMNGLELLQRLKAEGRLAELPVIMYTGAMTSSENLLEVMTLGAIDFVRKPAEGVELLSRLSTALRQRAQEREKRELLEAENRRQREELANNLLLLAQKQEFLQELEEDCRSGRLTSGQLARKIQQALLQEDYWGDFLAKFNQNDPFFCKKLLEIAPEITNAELRLAVLLRLGIDSKSIAHLLQISDEGVKKNRYRLRKKLPINSEENLDIYLVSV